MRFAHSPLTIAVLSALSTSVIANDQTQEIVTLLPIVSQAEASQQTGKTVYSKEDLEKNPNSSKNLTDFLKVNPSVQFAPSFRSALQQGDLTAADISIHGGLAYDNKITVNGLSINNTINPVGTNSSNSPDQILGSSQAAAINTDLLCNVTVLDSNVSAEYGEFTGGVISAETCAPTGKVGEMHGSISYDYTSDQWSRIQFPDPTDREAFENSSSEAAQPYFTKQGISSSVYGRLTEKLGFNAFGSYRHSAIPLKTEFVEAGRFEQERQARNAGLELFYQASDRTALKVGANFLQNEGLYNKANILNSESTQSSDSQSFYVQLKNQLEGFSLEQQLNYQTQAAAREAMPYSYSWKPSSSKNWGTGSYSFEGNLGDLNQAESRLEYRIKAQFEPVKWAGTTHQLKLGAGYGHYDAYWQRPEQVAAYAGPQNLNRDSCLLSSGLYADACDPAASLDGKFKGQFANALTLYEAGQVDIRQDRWHAYIEDQIQLNPYVSTTLGLRQDYDSINKNHNLAPRTALTLRPFADDRLRLMTGWNRYYGLNAFVNELNDRLDQFQTKYTRSTIDAGWQPKAPAKTTFTYRSDLDTPFTDEILVAMYANYKNTALGLKWVNRDNEDQLRKTKMNLSDLSYTYDNRGHSRSDIYTLSISNRAPLQFMGAQHRLALNADYSKTTRNFSNYDSTDNLTATPQIYYEGQIIDADDRPADEYNVPWTLRLNWDMNFNQLPLQISHFLSYQGKTDVLKRLPKAYSDERNVLYDMYVPYTTQNKFYWDIKASYRLNSTKNTQTIFGLTINNLTNHSNLIIDSNGDASPEIGRQFIADISFKF